MTMRSFIRAQPASIRPRNPTAIILVKLHVRWHYSMALPAVPNAMRDLQWLSANVTLDSKEKKRTQAGFQVLLFGQPPRALRFPAVFRGSEPT
jgi:hypothetical protein